MLVCPPTVRRVRLTIALNKVVLLFKIYTYKLISIVRGVPRGMNQHCIKNLKYFVFNRSKNNNIFRFNIKKSFVMKAPLPVHLHSWYGFYSVRTKASTVFLDLFVYKLITDGTREQFTLVCWFLCFKLQKWNLFWCFALCSAWLSATSMQTARGTVPTLRTLSGP